MPIYEYACVNCGHRFELRQSFSDEPVTDCTQCGARVRRVLHPAGVIFKGSGWYATDSRKAGSAASMPETSDNGSPTGNTSTETGKAPAAAAADD